MGEETSSEAIRERMSTVERRIAEAAGRAGRNPGVVRLIVITKGHSPAVVQAAYDAGARRLGENRVEEAVRKIEALPHAGEVEWHLVGPLQSRKARLVRDHFALIHAVDRLKVAQQLNARAAEDGRRQAVLLECNVTGEATKAGWRLTERAVWDEAWPELQTISGLANLRVRGLMTMAPLTADVLIQRETFRRLAALRQYLADRLGSELPELSMGMTDDYEIAIEEGATLVRIGRAILGERM